MAETAPKKSFRSFIWDTDTHLKSSEERKLLRKLDFSILTIGCLGFFLKYLDQGNLANAYVSGMQEDLHMYGNQYTYAGTAYTVAYAVMQVPSTLIIQKIRPSYWLACMEIGWGVFTFAQAGMKNVTQLYVFRFLVGFFESSFFPCLLFVLGSWYTKTELAKRIAIFHMTSPLGSAFGGYLQAAVYKSLNGHLGLAGWRWLYIVCGFMTVPVGFGTFFFFPDTPHWSKTKPVWFLTEAECELALKRVEKAGKALPVKITFETFKRIFSRWRWYAFTMGYILYGSSCQASGYFGIWLKAEHFSVVERNIIPTGTNLISVLCILMWGFGSDYTGSRILFVLGPLTYGLIPNGILAVWPLSIRLKEFAFLTCGVQLMTAIFYTWANEICADDNEERALVLSSMNGRGFPATFGFVIAALLVVVVIQLLAVRERRRKVKRGELEEGVVESNESCGEFDSKVPQVQVRKSSEFEGDGDGDGKKGGPV